MGSICLLSDGGLPSVSCVTHYSFVRSFDTSGRARTATHMMFHSRAARRVLTIELYRRRWHAVSATGACSRARAGHSQRTNAGTNE